MQQQMNLLETPLTAGAAPVWATLDDELQAEAVAVLARLIAKVADSPNDAAAADGAGKRNE